MEGDVGSGYCFLFVCLSRYVCTQQKLWSYLLSGKRERLHTWVAYCANKTLFVDSSVRKLVTFDLDNDHYFFYSYATLTLLRILSPHWHAIRRSNACPPLPPKKV